MGGGGPRYVGIGYVGTVQLEVEVQRLGILERSMCQETQVSASSCCDYPLPVCDPGSGHIGQGRIFLRTHRVRDASSQGRMIPKAGQSYFVR
jgi:hypothetical protein